MNDQLGSMLFLHVIGELRHNASCQLGASDLSLALRNSLHDSLWDSLFNIHPLPLYPLLWAFDD